MIEIQVNLPPGVAPSRVEAVLEKLCAEAGLTLTLKGTLARYPGSVHWHFKKGEERGTLEATCWESAGRFWFSVQAGRTGGWIEETLNALKPVLEAALTPES